MAIWIKASLWRVNTSYSRACRRKLTTHAKVRSTTQRRLIGQSVRLACFEKVAHDLLIMIGSPIPKDQQRLTGTTPLDI